MARRREDTVRILIRFPGILGFGLLVGVLLECALQVAPAGASSLTGRASAFASHPGAEPFSHGEEHLGECLACHVRHGTRVARYVHLDVECEACHLDRVVPVRDAGSRVVSWRPLKGPPGAGRAGRVVEVTRAEGACKRCHSQGNRVGVPAMVLPAKSVICMPCHPALPSAMDPVTLLALLGLGLGLASVGSVWLAGRPGGRRMGLGRGATSRPRRAAERGSLPARAARVSRAVFVDGLLQGRLFRASRLRWAIHGLLFFPLVLRFSWGLAGWLGSVYLPGWPGTWVLLDRNHPVTALVFDVTGLLLLCGLAATWIRAKGRASRDRPPGLPGPDVPAHVLLAGVVVAGFVLEGMRIAMAGNPGGTGYAFVGYAASRLFRGTDLTVLYGYGWYVHAVLTACLVAYLPFSRMLHMFAAPVSLVLGTAPGRGGRGRMLEPPPGNPPRD